MYTFGQIKKTVAATIGTGIMILGFLMENDSIRELLPPTWVTVIGAIVAVAGVFGLKNDESPEKENAVEAAVRVDAVLQNFKDKAPGDTPTALDAALSVGLGVTSDTLEQVDRIMDMFREKK